MSLGYSWIYCHKNIHQSMTAWASISLRSFIKGHMDSHPYFVTLMILVFRMIIFARFLGQRCKFTANKLPFLMALLNIHPKISLVGTRITFNSELYPYAKVWRLDYPLLYKRGLDSPELGKPTSEKREKPPVQWHIQKYSSGITVSAWRKKNYCAKIIPVNQRLFSTV